MGAILLGSNGQIDQQILLNDSIELPDSLPVDETILIEDEGIVEIPDSIPTGQSILTDVIPLTSSLPTPTIVTGDKYYVHTQSVASDVWHVYHNLQKRPAVHIEDSTGEEIMAQIIHITNNYLRVYFGKVYIGTAHCN